MTLTEYPHGSPKDRPRSADAETAAILKSTERFGRFPYIEHDGSAAGAY